MNSLEKHLNKIDATLHSKFEETKNEVNLLLGKYGSNFPNYTDHSINHTLEVFKIASELMTDEEIENLNADETYILSMACLLHDIGMCVPEDKIKEIYESKELLLYKESHPNLTTEEFIRDIHHTLSNKFIVKEWELLKIPSIKYAKAIGLVAEGHRKVDLGNFDIYSPQFFARGGKEFVCLPYLASILRIADELDVTNSRTPKILIKYYMPNNDISIREWQKHIATSQRNYLDEKVIFEVDCSDHNIYAALQDQFDKIQNVINYSQKIKRTIPFIKGKNYELNLSLVEVKYNFMGFDPKGIKFSFDVQNVVTTFIGEGLYKDKLTSLREALQNSIDSCRYKSKVLKRRYNPIIKVFIDDNFLRIEDNGAGMDEFIIENYFGRLASSFYEQEKIKSTFDAIGQFGVGVFSYFLISEYIDIETKTFKSNTLKFRFDKDPKSYFHFYDKTERIAEGTTISMYLKKELCGKLTFKSIENYIRTIFRHLEIPIEISAIENQTIIEFSPFEINEENCIKDVLKLQNHKLIDKLKIISLNINKEELEGKCALIVGKELANIFSSNENDFDREYFDTVASFQTISKISVSQKGVFVNDYPSSFLNFIIGDINIKKKIKINIDRNEFSDEVPIYSMIRMIEYNLLNAVFESIEKNVINLDSRLKVTNDFLSNYSNYFDIDYGYIDEFALILKKSLFVKVVIEGNIQIINMHNLFSQFQEFILISAKEDAHTINNHFNKPVVTANDIEPDVMSYDHFESILVKVFKLSPHINFYQDRAYKFYQIKNIDDSINANIKKIHELISSYRNIIIANSKKILMSTTFKKEVFNNLHHEHSSSINYNHFFVQFIILNYGVITRNAAYMKIIKQAFDFIYNFQFRSAKIDGAALSKLNEILKPLNEVSNLQEFTLDDFII